MLARPGPGAALAQEQPGAGLSLSGDPGWWTQTGWGKRRVQKLQVELGCTCEWGGKGGLEGGLGAATTRLLLNLGNLCFFCRWRLSSTAVAGGGAESGESRVAPFAPPKHPHRVQLREEKEEDSEH